MKRKNPNKAVEKLTNPNKGNENEKWKKEEKKNCDLAMDVRMTQASSMTENVDEKAWMNEMNMNAIKNEGKEMYK